MKVSIGYPANHKNYTYSEIKTLLEYYTRGEQNVFLCPAFLFEVNDINLNELREFLSALAQKNETTSRIVIPIHFGQNEWTVLYLIYSPMLAESKRLPAQYFNFSEHQLPVEIINHLVNEKFIRCEPDETDIHSVDLPEQQRRVENRDPAMVETVRMFAQEKLGMPRNDIDISKARNEHSIVLKRLLSGAESDVEFFSEPRNPEEVIFSKGCFPQDLTSEAEFKILKTTREGFNTTLAGLHDNEAAREYSAGVGQNDFAWTFFSDRQCRSLKPKSALSYAIYERINLMIWQSPQRAAEQGLQLMCQSGSDNTIVNNIHLLWDDDNRMQPLFIHDLTGHEELAITSAMEQNPILLEAALFDSEQFDQFIFRRYQANRFYEQWIGRESDQFVKNYTTDRLVYIMTERVSPQRNRDRLIRDLNDRYNELIDDSKGRLRNIISSMRILPNFTQSRLVSEENYSEKSEEAIRDFTNACEEKMQRYSINMTVENTRESFHILWEEARGKIASNPTISGEALNAIFNDFFDQSESKIHQQFIEIVSENPKIFPKPFCDMPFSKTAEGNICLDYPSDDENAEMDRVSIQRLFRAKVSVDTADEHGNTLLHLAVMNNDDQIARILLSRGARKEVFNDQGKTPLDLINKRSGKKLINLLNENRPICQTSFLQAERTVQLQDQVPQGLEQQLVFYIGCGDIAEVHRPDSANFEALKILIDDTYGLRKENENLNYYIKENIDKQNQINLCFDVDQRILNFIKNIQPSNIEVELQPVVNCDSANRARNIELQSIRQWNIEPRDQNISSQLRLHHDENVDNLINGRINTYMAQQEENLIPAKFYQCDRTVIKQKFKVICDQEHEDIVKQYHQILEQHSFDETKINNAKLIHHLLESLDEYQRIEEELTTKLKEAVKKRTNNEQKLIQHADARFTAMSRFIRSRRYTQFVQRMGWQDPVRRAQFLATEGVSPDAIITDGDAQKRLLWLARERNNGAAIRLFLECGANPFDDSATEREALLPLCAEQPGLARCVIEGMFSPSSSWRGAFGQETYVPISDIAQFAEKLIARQVRTIDLCGQDLRCYAELEQKWQNHQLNRVELLRFIGMKLSVFDNPFSTKLRLLNNLLDALYQAKQNGFISEYNARVKSAIILPFCLPPLGSISEARLFFSLLGYQWQYGMKMLSGEARLLQAEENQRIQSQRERQQPIIINQEQNMLEDQNMLALRQQVDALAIENARLRILLQEQEDQRRQEAEASSARDAQREREMRQREDAAARETREANERAERAARETREANERAERREAAAEQVKLAGEQATREAEQVKLAAAQETREAAARIAQQEAIMQGLQSGYERLEQQNNRLSEAVINLAGRVQEIEKKPLNPNVSPPANFTYTTEGICRLLTCYLRNTNIEFIEDMMTADVGRETSVRTHLALFHEQQGSPQCAKRRAIIPIYIGENHWSLLYLTCPQKIPKFFHALPKIHYFDPSGCQISSDLIARLFNGGPFSGIRIVDEGKRGAGVEGFRGAWIVEAARMMAEQGSIPNSKYKISEPILQRHVEKLKSFENSSSPAQAANERRGASSRL